MAPLSWFSDAAFILFFMGGVGAVAVGTMGGLFWTMDWLQEKSDEARHRRERETLEDFRQNQPRGIQVRRMTDKELDTLSKELVSEWERRYSASLDM